MLKQSTFFLLSCRLLLLVLLFAVGGCPAVYVRHPPGEPSDKIGDTELRDILEGTWSVALPLTGTTTAPRELNGDEPLFIIRHEGARFTAELTTGPNNMPEKYEVRVTKINDVPLLNYRAIKNGDTEEGDWQVMKIAGIMEFSADTRRSLLMLSTLNNQFFAKAVRENKLDGRIVEPDKEPSAATQPALQKIMLGMSSRVEIHSNAEILTSFIQNNLDECFINAPPYLLIRVK